MRNMEELNNKHQGETCFIVGAGPSLHEEDLSVLQNHLTICVNSGIVGLPTAKYFLSDDWSVAMWSYFSRDLVKSQTEVLLYEKMLGSTVCLFGNRSILFRHRLKYHITDHYDHNDKQFHICQARCSLGSAIHVAHIMGCSEIVLLGVDCCRVDGFRYFWQYPEFENKPFRNDGIPVDRYRKIKTQGKHTDTDLEDILRYWRTVSENITDKCKVYNASIHSVVDVFPRLKLSDVVI